MKKLKKIDYNVFFAAGGLTVRYTYSQVLFLGHRLARSCLLLLLFSFSFFRNVAAAAAAVAVRRRRPSNTYLPTLGYLTWRVADFTTLGTVP